MRLAFTPMIPSGYGGMEAAKKGELWGAAAAKGDRGTGEAEPRY